MSVINGDYQAAFTTMNYDGSSYIQSAAIDVYTDGPVSTNKVSSRIHFATRDTAGNFAYRMTLKSNGKLGIGTTNPSALTHISDGNLLVSGTLGSSPAIEFSGAGSKMFFYPRKSAIRAGYVTGTQWDDVNIGNFSVGLGANSLAKSDNSISIGEANTADVNPFAIAIGRQNYSGGFASLAMGHFSQATGHYSSSIGLRDTVSGYGASALGGYNTVGGTHAFAAGLSNTVNGDAATALGSSNYAPSYGETTIGHFATQYSALNANGINSADRLFTIGNGTGPGSRSDAMVMLKSGFTGLGTSTPNSTLQVDGTIAVGITMGIAGGPVGTPTLISTQKAYLGLSPAGANTYYQLPDPTLTPGRIYYIRNNDNTNSAWLGTVAGLLCPGSGTCLASGTWYELKATISVKSVMVISDGVNWSVFKMD
ncbi:MAG: hypothetical protein IPP31_06715 [Chitinophagaceae bacterium]|nr:hypothetical protein [Chitinophagaceae bacterium]